MSTENPQGYKPPITATYHELPFGKLNPLDFERLCLWLVRDEGYENAEHLGAAGSEQGRDIVAWKDGRQFAFQCKRVKSFSAGNAEKEIKKLRGLKEKKPDEVVFVVTAIVSADAREKAREAWGDEATCHFWSGSELDEKVKRHKRILKEFFQLSVSLFEPTNGFLHNLPFSPLGTILKGREGDLEALKNDLGETSTALVTQPEVLYGLGGIGKTRLAVEYAWRSTAKYSAAFFITVEGPEGLQRGLSELAGPKFLNLGLEGSAEDQEAGAVLRWLRENPGWLLILDNVDTFEAARAVKEFLPLLSNGHVLITSRLSRWPGEIHKRSLKMLKTEDAVRYLLERTQDDRTTGADDEALALQLAELLDGLPLALEQAASYVAVHGLSFAGYLESWQKEREAVLDWYDEAETSYSRSMAATWQHTFRQLGLTAKSVLRLMSHLAPEPVPVAMFHENEEIIAEAVALPADENPGEPETALQALADLSRHSLVTREGEEVSVHRMVQEVVRGRIPQEQRREWVEKAVRLVNEYAPADPDDVRTWQVWDRVRPHTVRVIDLAERHGVEQPTSTLMSQLGILLFSRGLFREAEPLLRRAFEIDKKSFGKEHPNVARDLNNLAQLLQATNRLSEAEPLMRRALEIDEKSFGKEHPDVAIDLNNLAGLLQATSRLSEAEPLMRRALEIDEKSFGKEHPEVATRLNNLATLLQATNRLSEAEPLMRRALEIDEKSFGKEHPTVAIDLNNLATLLQATNRLSEAEPLMRRALEIGEKSFGKEHPTVGIRLDNLATLLRITDRAKEAEPLNRRSLEIFRKSLGEDHPYTQTAKANREKLLHVLDHPSNSKSAPT